MPTECIDLSPSVSTREAGIALADEAGLAALSMRRVADNLSSVGWVMDTVEQYVRGTVALAIADRQARRNTGMSEAEWRAPLQPYMRRMLDGGNYPRVGHYVREAAALDPDAKFEFGLRCLLDGIEEFLHGRNAIAESRQSL